MSRLIDASKATEVVGYFLEQMGITLFGRGGKDLARTLLLQVPTIDAVEVVRGEWIDEPLASTNGGVYITHRCSVCEWQQPFEVFRYCPYCGARMDYKRKQYGERKESE